MIQTIHSIAIAFPQVADSVLDVLMEFLADGNKVASVDVIVFVKEVMERFPHLRQNIMTNLLDRFTEMNVSRTLRGGLWIIGEYADDIESN